MSPMMTTNVTIETAAKSYYDKGSEELAVETPVLRKHLETRRTMTEHTHGGERLLIVLVGLPARGKSFIARKLLNYMVWRGNQCRIFNVGKYRRQVATPTGPQQQTADFFDDSNPTTAKLRQEAAQLALNETLEWLQDVDDVDTTTNTAETTTTEDTTSCEDSTSGHSDASDKSPSDPYANRLTYSHRRKFHKIAIFDATNSTRERRRWILKECDKADDASGTRQRTGVLFIESICDNQELLQENLRGKIASSPDFENMTEEEALQDLQSRIAIYESRYETIRTDDHKQQISYIKIFNLSSHIMANHVYGRLAKVVLPAIMSWNTSSRPIYLIRAGETKPMEDYMKKLHQQPKPTTPQKKVDAMMRNLIQRKRSDRLGERGYRFRDAVGDFIEREGMEFVQRKNQSFFHPGKIDTGTSLLDGLQRTEDRFCPPSYDNDEDDFERSLVDAPFPCLVLSSTMPRAIETATWKHRLPVKDVTNLNPMDMGDFAGMDLASIKEQHPEWYKQLQRDPFYTRFPGGESYGDLIDRLYPIIIDMEQQLGLAVAVSHVSVLQVLVSYFRSSPIQKCMDIEIPMHTVMKFVPLKGGGWLESQHVLEKDGNALEPWVDEETRSEEPIWTDSRSCLPRSLG